MRNRWVTDGRDAAGYVHDSVGPTVAFPHKIWLGMAWTGLSHTLMIYFFPISGMLHYTGYSRQSLQEVTVGIGS